MSVTLDLSGTIHYMVAICGTQVENNYISRVFFLFFQNFGFFGCWEGERAKNGP